MTTMKAKGVIAVTLLVLLAFACGCHGRTGDAQPDNAIIRQTPQTQAKSQALLNDPRISPQMKDMLRRQMRQSGSGGAK